MFLPLNDKDGVILPAKLACYDLSLSCFGPTNYHVKTNESDTTFEAFTERSSSVEKHKLCLA